MARKTEAEFVNEGLTDDEIETLGTGQSVSTGSGAESDQGQAAGQTAEGDQAQQPEQKTVDIRALQEARAEARAAREELARMRSDQIEQSKKDAAERARIDERIALINQQFAAQNQPQVKPPSEDEDPIGFFKHEISTSKAEIEALKKQLGERDEAEKKRSADYEAGTRQISQNQAIIATAEHVINTAIAANPPLQEALNHALGGIRGAVEKYLETNNVPIEQRPMMAQRMLDNEALRLASQCPRDPAQAADFVMSYARFYGYGYQPQQNGQSQSQGQIQGQQGQLAQQQPNLQQRAEQQQRHMSLSGTQGGQAPAQLNAKALAEMSDEQFTALMKTADGRKKVDSILAGN